MLSAELIAKIRRLEIQSAKLVQELFSGKYKSIFKGHGIEFSDVRDYQWGDDIRAMHWKAMARFGGKPYLKRFTEERELTVMLAVDISGSLGFGSLSALKRDILAQTAGVIAYLAMKNRDRVGLALFTDKTELYLPARSSQTHTLRLLRELVGFEPHSKGTDLRAAMQFLLQTIKKRSIVFFASDFLDERESQYGFEKELAILAKKHDFIAISVTDPLEKALPSLPARLRLEDSEDPLAYVEINLRDRSDLEELKSHFLARYQQLKETLRRCGADHLELSTGTDFIDTLVGFFARRERQKAMV